MVPIIDGKVHHFACIGVHNGLLILGDDETGSYWDHVSGECLHGSLKGEKLACLPVNHLSVRAALKRWPDLAVAIPRQSFFRRYFIQPIMRIFANFGIFPPGFRRTMDKPDTRLPEMTSGLGLYSSQTKRFYPIQMIRENGNEWRDELDGREIKITLDSEGFPHAVYTEGEDVPMQLFTRWYGFSYTFPGCEIGQK
ncbi:DUF3179 domain-containing protein [Kroppenstedtia pulmonis]|uniref:DUF3179 domain-containing protein n=2 Tax=Kroppenstedtia pulmonis TaxID=1380685 RepID=A0A7D4C5D2_9BACL|nr:DUF3179 domain-containing protein [Kroppenstedtia pulmonis]